ncbi:sigma-54 dependent transcriptional regulator [Anoxynatronum sibiricum]|uniref:Stage 0 sporulation protein A homolog n=1 Tax=Anoxynatronum sibiricum TaxID=210623 RepID=A0ABU9VWY5_9CLOT
MKNLYKILIVDDEVEYQHVLSLILSDVGYKTATCSNGQDALNYMEEQAVNLVITDLKMPVMDGMTLIREIKKKHPAVDVIVMTAFGSIESAVDAIKYGAVDYYVKSGDMDDLVIKVNRLAKLNRLEFKNTVLLKNQNDQSFFLESLSPLYLHLLELCQRAADTGISILLLGESGVGKEVIANYIHRLSSRQHEPFVPINCQVFPEGVIDSELFGHEKGSFTGAIDCRAGKFEQANLGTLFMDEIGDLPLSTQGKLLRAIESRKIQRLGSNKSLSLDIRFISATNKHLNQLIAEGTFREDLLHRINTLTLTIPPLRERKEDLPSLIQFFIQKIEQEQKKKVSHVDQNVMDFLLSYDYPGNIRELKNIIERMIALSKDGRLTSSEILLPAGNSCASPVQQDDILHPLKEARAFFEKNYIRKALERHGGNVAKTSKTLDISTRQLWNKLNQYHLHENTRDK